MSKIHNLTQQIKSESLIITKKFLALPKAQRDKLWSEYSRTYNQDPINGQILLKKKQRQPTRKIAEIKLPPAIITPKPEPKATVVMSKEIDLMLANGWGMDEIKERFGEKIFDQK